MLWIWTCNHVHPTRKVRGPCLTITVVFVIHSSMQRSFWAKSCNYLFLWQHLQFLFIYLKIKRPKSVLAGTILFFSALLIGIPSLLVNAMYAPEEQSKSAIIGTGLLFQSLTALLDYMIYSRRNWARNLNATLMVFGTLLMFTSEQAGIHHAVVNYLSWTITVLYWLASILFFMPASDLWFGTPRNTKNLTTHYWARLGSGLAPNRTSSCQSYRGFLGMVNALSFSFICEINR